MLLAALLAALVPLALAALVPLALAAIVPLALADDHNTLRLRHRIFHPSIPDVPFSDRGALALSSSGPHVTAHLVPSDDLKLFAEALQGKAVSFKDVLYQVALEHPGDQNSAQWVISSVKACHLARSTQESITLHLAADGTPYTFDYFVGPIPHNGACPKKNAKSQADLFDLRPITNSTVIVRSPTFPPLPQLRAPPPITPEGKIAEPVPEKSFIQKYWIYMVVAVIALVLSPGPEEEKAGAKK
ncbi:hypothetical protein EUX98_g589 [Antrodiella citrinella]|uniref:Uncharacterized protein n=1 Tax=Antrodiella citrinella TaxID=2447956 RepID=A0A4S4N3T4_9APHY|nr:hypothetical protein EUX98_g589 [Antrodiella citrinella]